MAVRCSKHPMMWEPCSICKEIEHYKLLVKSAESEMKETEFWNENQEKEKLELEEELDEALDSIEKLSNPSIQILQS